VEATISQAVRSFGLRRARYVGLAKARLQHVATAAAINLVRLVRWIVGAPMASTRDSRFARLVARTAPA
jgi:transposase